MSNIYIQEPPTNGKVLLKTSLGDIDIELWTKEAPKACRNFIQLCMEGYYDNCIFHRIVKGFIAQGGDPTGTGFGGESIYGEPFKDEFHSRIKFNRRGLVAMANAGKNDNGSQFFFTLAPTPELQGKHTIFGKVTGKTIYNMIKLDELQVDKNDKPLNPPKIIRTEILSNPFDDILPRDLGKNKKNRESEKDEKAASSAAKKDFKLLSFGDEAEEEEEIVSQVTTTGSKSSHDLTDDPNLSSVPAVESSKSSGKRSSDAEKEKHKKKRKSHQIAEASLEPVKEKPVESDDSGAKKVDPAPVEKEEKSQKDKLDEVRDEYKKLKMEMIAERRKKLDKELDKNSKEEKSEALAEFLSEKQKYKEAKLKVPRKGTSDREEQTLAVLSKFKQKLQSEDSEETGSSWLSHKFVCSKEEEGPVLAKDANMRGEGEWYDLYDPRNKIAQRRAMHGNSK